jgi:hypothetical protein
MKRLAAVLAVVVSIAMAGASAAFAQSSGSFSASFGSTSCAIDSSSGTLSGGITSLPPVTVKVSSGSGVALVITPSLLTGLYTSNKLSQTTTTSTENIGIQVQVTVDGSTATVVPELGSSGVIYDQRFVQVQASFLNGLSTCYGNCFTITQSTLSAHAFNFYIWNLASGTHTVSVSWTILGGTNNEAACVGPGTLTVQQVKNFSFNSALSF